MGNPTGNVVPVLLDETEPDGAVIQVRDLDDAIREGRLALKTFLERSMVAFGDPKAGEMKPGTALPIVNTSNNLIAAGTYPPADWEGRLGLAYDGRQFYSWRDLGAGIEVYRVGHIAWTPNITYVKAFSVANQVLAANTWTEVGPGTTAQLTSFTRRNTGGTVRANINFSVPVYNGAAANRGFTARIMYNGGAGYVETLVALGSATRLTHYPFVNLRQATGTTLVGMSILHSITLAPGNSLNLRVEVYCDGDDGEICGNAVNGHVEEAAIIVHCEWQPI